MPSASSSAAGCVPASVPWPHCYSCSPLPRVRPRITPFYHTTPAVYAFKAKSCQRDCASSITRQDSESSGTPPAFRHPSSISSPLQPGCGSAPQPAPQPSAVLQPKGDPSAHRRSSTGIITRLTQPPLAREARTTHVPNHTR